VTAVVVLVFGSLTLILHDQTFIKLKPTIIYCLFGATLLGGYIFNKPLLAIVFDSMFHLTEEGWRKLTLRWAVFFFVLAVGNEIARHTLNDFWWGWSKLIVFAPLNFVFAAFQYPLIMKYATEEPNPEAEAEREET
jgi:intracellular septation protein